MAENGGTKSGSGTAEGLMEFFDFLVAKGYATPAAVTPLKSASRQILSTVDGDEYGKLDVRDLDVDAYLDRFENMVVGQYKHESVVQYRNRFRRGLSAYLAYLNDKQIPSFRATGRKGAAARSATTPKSARTTATPAAAAVPASTADRLIDYPFPLRSGQIAILRLPVVLEKTDAERMGAFIRTLVLDAQGELTRGESHEVRGVVDVRRPFRGKCQAAWLASAALLCRASRAARCAQRRVGVHRGRGAKDEHRIRAPEGSLRRPARKRVQRLLLA